MSSVAGASTLRRHLGKRRPRVLLSTLAVTASVVGYGAPGSVTAAEPPADLSGYWMIPYGGVPPRREPTAFEQTALDLLPPNAVLLRDSGLFEMPPGDYGGLRVRPQALEQARAYDPEVQRAFATTCQPPSVIHAMQGPFPIEIFQATELIVIRMEYFDLVRIVFLDRDDHPAEWPHSPVGHSLGHWDGDTFVVETRFLSAATIFNNRGQEATPLVVDGVMYLTVAVERRVRVDAATGELLWRYDPQVPREWGGQRLLRRRQPRRRGLERQASSSARSTGGSSRSTRRRRAAGRRLTVDRAQPYTITGAPRIVRRARCSSATAAPSTACAATSPPTTRRRASSPGASTPCPATPPTARRERGHGDGRRDLDGEWWTLGGGGTVWDAIVYDPELDLSTSASATAARGTRRSAAPAAATTCSSPRSSRSIRTTASTSGTTRRRRARPGTTRPRSRSCSPTSRSTA
jgi:hypothetical protein